jgi:CRP-like cAMP-binding protein
MQTISIKQQLYDLSPATLKQGSIFGAISNSAIEFLLSEGKLCEFAAQEVIFHEGDAGDSFYILLYGDVAFYKGHAERPTLIRTIVPGEALGYVTMIALSPRAGTARTEKNSLLLRIDSHVFAAFHDTHSFDFGIMILNLSRDMARQIQRLSGTIADLTDVTRTVF